MMGEDTITVSIRPKTAQKDDQKVDIHNSLFQD